jgi:hypothetical protein
MTRDTRLSTKWPKEWVRNSSRGTHNTGTPFQDHVGIPKAQQSNRPTRAMHTRLAAFQGGRRDSRSDPLWTGSECEKALGCPGGERRRRRRATEQGKKKGRSYQRDTTRLYPPKPGCASWEPSSSLECFQTESSPSLNEHRSLSLSLSTVAGQLTRPHRVILRAEKKGVRVRVQNSTTTAATSYGSAPYFGVPRLLYIPVHPCTRGAVAEDPPREPQSITAVVHVCLCMPG